MRIISSLKYKCSPPPRVENNRGGSILLVAQLSRISPIGFHVIQHRSISKLFPWPYCLHPTGNALPLTLSIIIIMIMTWALSSRDARNMTVHTEWWWRWFCLTAVPVLLQNSSQNISRGKTALDTWHRCKNNVCLQNPLPGSKVIHMTSVSMKPCRLVQKRSIPSNTLSVIQLIYSLISLLYK